MEIFKKNIWNLFLIVFFAAFSFLIINMYTKWNELHDDYVQKQESLVQLLSNATKSLFLTQEMMLDILGNEVFKHKKSDILDNLLKLNPTIVGFGLANTNGQLVYMSSNIDVTKIPNLKAQEISRDSFIKALNSDKMVLGRTYYFNPIGDWVIPIRKALKNDDNHVIAVMTAGIRVQGAYKLFNNKLHINEHNEVFLVRDDDKYIQFVSTDRSNKNDYYKEALSSEVVSNTIQKITTKYKTNMNEIKKDERIFSFENINRYGEATQVVMRYINRYDLWIVSQIEKRVIYKEFMLVSSIYLAVFLAVIIVLYLLFLSIATAESKRRYDLVYQATHDSLTGLPNRDFIRKNIDKWVNESQKEFCIFFIDIDHFKNINDSYGHYFGDQVLIEVGRRLKSLSSTDALIARQGSDEFVLFTYITNEELIKEHANQIIHEISKPYYIDLLSFNIGISIGIAKYPEHGDSLDQLSLCSDIAMYESKKVRNSYRVFDTSMKEQYTCKLTIEHDLRKALKANEFFMMYQPQVNGNGKIYSVEALVRWNSGERGLVPPDKFIPIAETSGLMTSIGRLIINNSLKEIKSIIDEFDIDISLSINISVKQFMHSDFINCFITEIEENGFDTKKVTIEITESLFVEDIEYVINILNILHEKGIKISMDDFGTGYSSLSILRTLPIDELKIDKSFVDNIIEDKSAKNMIKNIISIGQNLHMELIAEGVESQEQVILLQSLGCKYFQGYYFSKPLSCSDLKEYIKASNL